MHPEVLTEQGKRLFPRLKRFDEFYLAGGTGLALQVGHRISEDFDLFTANYLPDDLLDSVESVFEHKEVFPAVNNSEELTVFIDETKITFLRYPFELVNQLQTYQDVSIMEISEIAATKAYTVGRRGSFQDYVDLYFCLQKERVSLRDIIDLAREKYGGKFNDRLFLEQLLYLEDIKSTGLRFLGEEVGKNEIRSFFEKEIGKIDL